MRYKWYKFVPLFEGSEDIVTGGRRSITEFRDVGVATRPDVSPPAFDVYRRITAFYVPQRSFDGNVRHL